MVRAKQEDAWAHTANLLAMMSNCAAQIMYAPTGKKVPRSAIRQPADFSPFKQRRKRRGIDPVEFLKLKSLMRVKAKREAANGGTEHKAV